MIEHNPFTQSRQMLVEELTVTFRGIGRDKVVATCFFNNLDSEGTFILDNFYFNTYLAEPSQ